MTFKFRYKGTMLQRFLSWWGGELLGFLPSGLRERLRSREDCIALVPQADGGWLIVHAFDGHYDVLRRCPPGVEAAELSAIIASVRSGDDGRQRPLIVLLEASEALLQELELPLAAEESLRDVLSYEMDSHTPFSADQVEFDFRVLQRDVNAGKLRLRLGVAPKSRVAALLNDLVDAGAEPQRIDVLFRGESEQKTTTDEGDSAIGGCFNLNLLPPDQRPAVDFQAYRTNLALGLLALALLVGVMLQSIAIREQRSESLEQLRADLGVQARQVTQLRSRLDDAIVGANFLVEKKHAQRMVVEVLNDLSARLTDATYVERLTISDNAIQLHGQSDSSSQVIGLLTESPVFSSVSLEGQVQRDGRTGKDRFRLEARITPSSGYQSLAGDEEGENADPAG